MKAFKVRRNGEHYFRVELPRDFSPDGKRKSVVASTRHEALEKAQELLDQKKKGLKIDESRSSLVLGCDLFSLATSASTARSCRPSAHTQANGARSAAPAAYM